MGDLIDHVDAMLAEEAAATAEADAAAEAAEAPKAPEPAMDVIPKNTIDTAVRDAKETVEEGEEDAEDADETGLPLKVPPEPAKAPEPPPKAEKKPEPEPDPLEREYEVKVYGETKKVPAKELVARYQKAEASEQLMEEATTLKRSYESTMKAFLQKPFHTFEQLLVGQIGNPAVASRVAKELAAEWLTSKLEFEQLPPDQQRALTERQEMDLRQKREQEERERAVEETTKRERAAMAQRMDLMITNAVLRSGMPDIPDIKTSVAKEVLRHRDHGMELTFEQAAEIIKAKREEDFTAFQATLPPGELAKKFPEFSHRLKPRSGSPAKTTKGTAETEPRQEDLAPTKPRRDGQPKFDSVAEYNEWLDKKFRS